MMTLENKFGFGKYKGSTIKDVWTGPTSNYQDTLKNYFIGFFRFVKTNYEQPTSFTIPHDYLPIEDFLANRVGEWNESFGDFNVVVSSKYLAIESAKSNLVIRVNREIQKIFSGRFDIPANKLYKGGTGKDTTLTESLKISSDSNYIIWCLKTIKNFCIVEEELEKLDQMDCHSLEKIIIKEIKPDLLEFKALYILSRIEIDDTIKTINSTKLKTIRQTRDEIIHNRDDFETRTFAEYAGYYAQDVMGYSDEEIDDIFDGDPDAYWNID